MSHPLRFHVRPKLADPVLVLAFEGWNDAGDAATLAARYVAEQLHAAPLAEIDCEEFYDFTVRRPLVRLDAAGARRIEWPRTEFRFASLGENHEIVIGLGAEPHLRWRAYAELVAELARELGVRRAVLLGAFLADVVYSRPVDVTGFASVEGELKRIGVESSSYQGPTGIVGVLADRLGGEGVEVVSLWAALPHYITASPNPRGALALLKRLADATAVRVDETRITKDAAEFEERIAALVSADPELSEYVRQLKRREFAQ